MAKSSTGEGDRDKVATTSLTLESGATITPVGDYYDVADVENENRSPNGKQRHLTSDRDSEPDLGCSRGCASCLGGESS